MAAGSVRQPLWPDCVHGPVATLLFDAQNLDSTQIRELAVKAAELFAKQAPNGNNRPEDIANRQIYVEQFVNMAHQKGKHLRLSDITASNLFTSMVVSKEAPYSQYPAQMRQQAHVMICGAINHFEIPVIPDKTRVKALVWADGYMRACLTEEVVKQLHDQLLQHALESLRLRVHELAQAQQINFNSFIDLLNFARLTTDQFATSLTSQARTSLDLLMKIFKHLSLAPHPQKTALDLIAQYKAYFSPLQPVASAALLADGTDLSITVAKLQKSHQLDLPFFMDLLDFARLTIEQFSTSEDPLAKTSLDLLTMSFSCLSLAPHPQTAASEIISYYTKEKATIFQSASTSS